ncbi:DUF29 domain-containing protein [Candidatus Contendibacter odensensis]|uniref:DUF29 domain-containing protein n=1 Tax=Candidatus Contendobacter odensis Run_B_J11 TaxID=1400861 RepID=A0A7U7J5X6_9GAMM|nr:DUF29 domain-containing protein [Candidatus Contendobacter odensis]CDH47362.1 conserved hypothetical protein [Candidatus Contendobacter odensis Run_B_J11]
MATLYQQDVIAWANQQAALLRAGRFAEIDLEQVAEEISDVGKSEQRELAHRMAVLLAHLLKWQFQSERRGHSGRQTIVVQRRAIAKRLQRTPSLKTSLADVQWWEEVWADGVALATEETGLVFPEACLWSADQIMSGDFWPDP